jgi:hypothetical protein
MRSRLTVGFATMALAVVLVTGVAGAQLLVGYESARQLGMGRAYVAVSDDAGGVFSNPAGLASAGGAGGVAMGQVNSEAQRSGNAAYVAASADGMAASALGYRFIETKDAAPFETEGATYGFGQMVSTDTALGAALNWWKANEKSLALEDTGWSVDVGVLAGLPVMIGADRLRVGLVVNSVNQPTIMGRELQRTATVGVAARPVKGVLVAADVFNVFDDPGASREVRLGAEVEVAPRMAARVGYITEGEIVTFGFSYMASKFGVDYALANLEAEDVNLLGVRFAF